MARPHKIGIDYFNVDVKFDEKVETIELLHGNNGLVWIFKFWQTIYQTEFGEIKLDGLFGELHANKCRITIEEHFKILNTAIQVGFCYKDDDIYTSNGVKKRISSVSKERAAGILRNEERKKEAKKERYINNSILKESKVKETTSYSANNSRITSNNENNAINQIEKRIKTMTDEQKEEKLKELLSNKSDIFLETFEEFKVMRKKIKKPTTLYAEILILLDLNKLSNDENIQINALNKAIRIVARSCIPTK